MKNIKYAVLGDLGALHFYFINFYLFFLYDFCFFNYFLFIF